VKYRLAQPDEVHQLAHICDRFHPERLIHHPSFGMIVNPIGPQQFEQLIASSKVVIATDGDEIGGYYAFDHWPQVESPDTITYLEAKLAPVLQTRNISRERCAFGAQCVIDAPHQGKGIRSGMLAEVLKAARPDFDMLFSRILKNNPRALAAHAKDHWHIVAEDDLQVFVTLDMQ
jgi:GNAT superfamily N-acetyltransferase